MFVSQTKTKNSESKIKELLREEFQGRVSHSIFSQRLFLKENSLEEHRGSEVIQNLNHGVGNLQ